jgi:hypothetical protein
LFCLLTHLPEGRLQKRSTNLTWEQFVTATNLFYGNTCTSASVQENVTDWKYIVLAEYKMPFNRSLNNPFLAKTMYF